MHRKVKGLLSLILACVMAAVTVNPVLADELPAEQVTEETVSAEPESVGEEETETVGESETTQIESIEEQELSESESAGQETEETVSSDEVSLSTDEEWELLYDALPESYKGFQVYIGETTLEQLRNDPEADIRTALKTGMWSEEPMVGSADLAAQGGTISKTVLDNREGDAKFYRLTKWNVWKVDSDGLPESNEVINTSMLNRVATKDNFKKAAHLENWGTAENPSIICQKPIIEPVFECINYPIPIYDKDGKDTGEKFTINAENYNSISFPTGIEADSWMLIYNGIEYQLTAPSDVWTNDSNGIRMTGIMFAETTAKLQACVVSAPEENQYEISGEQGNEGWYIGAVTIRAKDDCQIRLSQSDEWSDAVSVTESGDVTIFLKKSDGTELPAETLSFLIDQTAPVISGIQNGGTYYSDEVTVVVTDEHLHTVTINGGAVGIINNRADIVLRPSENPFIIVAEDMAGNWIECIVWVKEPDVPPVLKEGIAEFMQPDWYEGQPKPEPVVSSATNGVENITYYYKEAGADDSTYTMIQPGKAGAYTAKAVFAATEEYQEVIRTADFQILPIQVILQEGTAEFVQFGWYEGQPKPDPVVSSATNGVENITYYYKEAGADDSTYTTVVPEKAGKYTAKAVFAATDVYQEVIRTSDFEILPNIPVEEEDKTAPVISGVSNGQTYYGDQTVTVTDENLYTVTVNGETVEVLNNRADIILKPSEDVYKIAASDKAGNKTELTVEVLETWVRDGIMTNGKKKLRRERLYKLGSGQWTIDGDSTVYSGNGTFYVKNSGEYNFKRK